ncbi:MAG: FG-GAP-like repeat-containing protein, partial [Bryobacteraceae bacterium]
MNLQNLSGLQFPYLVAGDFNGDGKLDVAAVDGAALGLWISLGNGDGTFRPGQTLGGFSDASAIVASDFNADGFLDVAVLQSGAGILRVAIGHGDGTFEAAESYPLHAQRLATGDFNGDGIVDIIATDYTFDNGGIYLLSGKGDASFAGPTSVSVGNPAGAVVVADINNDGIADLTVQAITGDPDGYQAYLGNGDGTFAAVGSPVPLTHQISDIATADFDGDGKTDLVIANGSGVSFLRGNGDGTFRSPVFFPVAHRVNSLAIADVNGDGKLDIVVGTGYPDPGNELASSFLLLLGDGSGSFMLNPFRDGYVVWPMVLGDFNSDGRVDIFEGFTVPQLFLGLAPTDLGAAISHSGTITQGQTGLIFTAAVSNSGPAATAGWVVFSVAASDGITITDITGPGWQCSGTGCHRTDALTPGTSYPVTLTASISDSALPSLNITGKLTIEGMSDPNPANDTATDSFAVIQHQTIVFGSLSDLVSGAPAFRLHAAATSGLPVSYAAAGNCTLSGVTVAVTGAGSCAITARQPGDSLYLPAPDVVRRFTVGAAATTVTLTASAASARLGASVTVTATIMPSAAQGRVAFYDGDSLLGTTDVAQGMAHFVVNTSNTGIRRIYARYLGTQPWPGATSPVLNLTVTSTPAFNYTPTSVPSSGGGMLAGVAAGDFNGDGFPDIVGVADFAIVVSLGDGAGHLAPPVVTWLLDGRRDNPNLAIGDFNGDGKLDVAVVGGWQSYDQNASVWLSKGDGSFQLGQQLTVSGSSITAADFNGDGFADLAISRGATPIVSVLLSKGDGTFEAPINYTITGDWGDLPLAAADLDRDGAVDLIVVTPIRHPEVDNRISVLMGRGDGTFLQPAGWIDDVAQVTSPSATIAVGDLNNDGLPDLVIPNGLSYLPQRCSVSALLGNGDGTFQVPRHYLCSSVSQVSANGNPAGVAIADFTGDGKADIAALFNFNDGYLQLFSGNGDGTFAAASVYQYSAAQAIGSSTFDFNGDGRPDLTARQFTNFTLLQGVPGPALRLTTTPIGRISPGSDATYTIAVSNGQGATATIGDISVSYHNTGSLAITSIGGSGWSCTNGTCTRSDALAGGSSFPPIIVQLHLDFTPIDGFISITTVSGGGSPGAESVDTGVIAGSPSAITAVNIAGTALAPTFTVAANAWLEIHGVNLVPATTPAAGVTWANAPEFASGRMPTQLDGISVTINQQPAYIFFYCSAATSPVCSTDQVNALAPPDIG